MQVLPVALDFFLKISHLPFSQPIWVATELSTVLSRNSKFLIEVPQRIVLLLFCLISTLVKLNLPFNVYIAIQPSKPSVAGQERRTPGCNVPGWVF